MNISIHEYAQHNSMDTVFYIEKMDFLEIKNTSFEWIRLHQKKSIEEMRKNETYHIYDIRDEIICRLNELNKNDIVIIKKNWLHFFEYSFDINTSNEIFITEPPYRVLNVQERFILLVLIVLQQDNEKFRLIFLDRHFSDFLKYKLHEYIKGKKVIIFSNDINWIYAYGLNNKLQTNFFNVQKIDPLLYVEGEIDLFTFSLIYNNKQIKNGYTSSQILWMAQRQIRKINHYYIDKDGYCEEAVYKLKDLNIKTSDFSEIENFWIMPTVLSAWLSDLQFTQKEIKNILDYNKDNIIKKAQDNFETVFTRFKNRQHYIKKQKLPYFSEKQIKEEYIKRKEDIENKDITLILSWLDNKNLLVNLIKKAGYSNIKTWQKSLSEHKLLTFKNISKQILNQREDT